MTSSTASTDITTATTTKKHPIRGFLYGIVFGLGLALIAIGQKWVALGTKPPVIIFVVGVVLGTLWSMFGPAKAPKGPQPASPAAAAPPEAPAMPATEEPSPAAETEDGLTESDEMG